MKVGGTHIACTAFGTLRMYASNCYWASIAWVPDGQRDSAADS